MEVAAAKLGPAKVGSAPKRQGGFTEFRLRCLQRRCFPPVLFDVLPALPLDAGENLLFLPLVWTATCCLENYYANPAISRAMVLSSPNGMSFPHSVGTSGSVHRPKENKNSLQNSVILSARLASSPVQSLALCISPFILFYWLIALGIGGQSGLHSYGFSQNV